MKEYMLIAVCMLAGKYVDVPIWLNIFSVSRQHGQCAR